MLIYVLLNVFRTVYVHCLNLINIFPEPDPTYTFVKPLNQKTNGYSLHEAYMECTVSSNMAQVSWYKGKNKLEVLLGFNFGAT